jgi:hypothetical protein
LTSEISSGWGSRAPLTHLGHVDVEDGVDLLQLLALLFGLLTRRVRSNRRLGRWCGTRSSRSNASVSLSRWMLLEVIKLGRDILGRKMNVALTHGVNFGRTVWSVFCRCSVNATRLSDTVDRWSLRANSLRSSMTLWRQKGHACRSSGGTPGSLVQVVHRLVTMELIVLFFRQRALKGIRGGDYFDMLWVYGLSMQSDRHMHLRRPGDHHTLSSMLWRASSSL